MISNALGMGIELKNVELKCKRILGHRKDSSIASHRIQKSVGNQNIVADHLQQDKISGKC